MFRRSRAMHLYRNGMPLALLSEFLGHENPETTLIYASADTEMKRKAIERASSQLAIHEAAIDYLNTNRKNKSVRAEVNNVDITVKTVAGENIFYELKTSDVKHAIRLAVGQLLEYCHYSNKTKVNKLIIVTKFAPGDKDIAYLKQLRTLYKIPIYYQQFDMEEKKLANLY